MFVYLQLWGPSIVEGSMMSTVSGTMGLSVLSGVVQTYNIVVVQIHRDTAVPNRIYYHLPRRVLHLMSKYNSQSTTTSQKGNTPNQ